MVPILVFSILSLFFCLCSSLNSDGLSLLALRAAVDSDPTRSMRSWDESDPDPCGWTGVLCRSGRVSSVELVGKMLTGYIPSELGLLDSLESLSLSRNNFSGLVPVHLFNATGLVSLDLSRNSLSGPVPAQIGGLTRLNHLDLSSNLLNGSLPESISGIGALAGTVNLSCNRFSGEIPVAYGRFPVFVSLDLRLNNLTGKIPQVGSLLNQGPTAFAGNPFLCGFPISSPCPAATIPATAASSGNTKNPEPDVPVEPERNESGSGSGPGSTGSMFVPVVSGVSVVVGAVSISAWAIRKKWRSDWGKTGITKTLDHAAADVAEDVEGQKGKFVVIDEGFGLELEDLLRASAYVVGKGKSGIVYKVVAGRRCGAPAAVVAVRRLSEGGNTWRLKEFESEVEAVGRVHHPNIVRLRAYYFANDEKLLVSDFIGNGSLYTALHGGPDSSTPTLSWSARLKIVQGTARGLMYIHEYTPRKYIHGNLKSTKILLNDDLQPYISGFGLSRLAPAASASRKQNPTQTLVSSTGSMILLPSTYYIAPEARLLSSGGKSSQKCDVYSFGIVLMEVLTGREPDAGLEGAVRRVFREERPLSEIVDPALVREARAKKQVVAAFHVALNCTEVDPELRPRMRTVSESLDRIKLR